MKEETILLNFSVDGWEGFVKTCFVAYSVCIDMSYADGWEGFGRDVVVAKEEDLDEIIFCIKWAEVWSPNNRYQMSSKLKSET